MKVPLEWLKEYVTIRLAPEVLAERLTMAGLEVTAIERVEGDHVLHLEVTPNRADCLSIIGVAREVAVLTSQRLRLPGEGGGVSMRAAPLRAQAPSSKTARGPKAVIHIEDHQGCVRYIGRLINDVRIGPSPAWMQKRLAACGSRAINAIVDITNYVLLEYGQPLHAFDFDRLAQGTILVRRAQAQERITTLDGVTRTLAQEMLVIADAKQPVAVAGIMGGSGSEVTAQTRVLLLESALFDPISVRRTARKLGLATESSYRFERGVDPAGVEAASLRAGALIQEFAGGEELTCTDTGSKPLKRTGIVLDTPKASRWLGVPLSPTAVRTTLAKLGCQVATSGAGGALHVGVPSFRRDLTQDVDLYEELARTTGYDHLPSTMPVVPMAGAAGEASAEFRRAQSLRCLCASLGLTEILTWSLLAEEELKRCGLARQAVRLANPLSQDHAWLRPSLLPGFLQAVRRNATQGMLGLRFFEVGHIMPASGAGQPAEEAAIGIALSGVWARDWRTNTPCDFFRLKGLLEAITGRLCGGSLELRPSKLPWARVDESTEVLLEGHSVGMAGRVAPAITEALDVLHPVWFAELRLEGLLASRRASPKIAAPAVLPPVKRDLSMVLSDRVPFAEADRTLRAAAGPLAWRIELVDRYTGKPVPAGHYSLTCSIEYRDPSKTLTDAEVDAAHRRIVEALTSGLGAQLRQ